MSKWVNKEKFEQFKNERENDTSDNKDNITYARKYPNPKMGSMDHPKEYHMRMITDPNGDFYKKYHYHMFQTGESWNFIMCPKTKGMDEYCPWCASTQLLYKGSESDKKKAYTYKRKDKYVGNVYVIRDPRDADQQDDDKKLVGKSWLYEFPQTIETLVKKEITDTENGWGYDIFDPQDGYNLIISIGAKKADKNGKVWPDYSLTAFSKRPSSIADTDEGITEIMEECQSINEYIENSLWTPEQHKELLESEMLYDDIEESFLRHMAIEESEAKPDKDESKSEAKPDKDESKSDDELLAELANM